VIVLVGVASLTLRAAPDVPIVRAERLVNWLRSQPVCMDEEVVAELALRLRRPGIWAAADPVPDARARFAALDAEVGGAAAVRRLWAVGGVATALGAVYSLTTAALTLLTGR
jgi:hypothetical protein